MRWSRWVLAVLVAVGLVVVPASLAGVGAQVATATESPAGTSTDAPVVIELFFSITCPHCHAEIEWLQGFVTEHPEVAVEAYEITGNAANRDYFAARASELGFTPRSVPTTIIGDVYWVGYSDDVAAQIEAVVLAALEPEPVGPTETPIETPTEFAGGQVSTLVDIPLFGTVDLGNHSLLVATLAIGFLDGVNPCSLWVLSMLLALVVHTRSRRRVFAVGMVFLTITTALYGVYMLGIYSVLATIAYLTWIRVGVAAIAGTMGLVNLLDAFNVNLPVKLRIPEQRKPQLYRRMRKLSRTEASLGAALGGTALLAVGVSLLETPCTAGFPVMWGNLLSSQGVDTATTAVLFSLYMLVFLLDELIVFGIAVFTLRAKKLQADEGALLKLAGGVVMLTLAGVMIGAPTLLESIAGTVAVFAAAAATTALLYVWVRRRQPQPVTVGHRAAAAPASGAKRR